jgi:hypothetical protein
MKNATILHDFTPEQMASLFKGIQNQLTELKKDFQPNKPDELMTRNEAAEMLKCDLSSLWNWTKKGKLIAYGLSNRVYYKRSEIEKALVCLGKKSGGNDE